MSNLFKYNTVQCEPDKKVIDYNELIAEKLSKLQNTRQDLKSGNRIVEDGFQAGLFAREVAITEEEAIEEIEEPIISAQELIDNAKEEAIRIVEEAKEQAELIKQETFQEASKKGYEEGYEQGLIDIKEQKDQLELKRQKMVLDYQNHLEQMEPMLVDAITTVVQSVFKVKFEDNRNMILHLLKIALGQIESSKDFIVKVSKADYPFVLKYKEVLEKATVQATNINIMEDIGLTKNQCLIETDGGVFDCGLDVQLDNLTKTLKILSMS